MSVTNFQVLFEFVNENLVINTKLTITADAKTTVVLVVSSDKSAVVSVSRDNACADRFVPADARRNIRVLCSLARRCQTFALFFYCVKVFRSVSKRLLPQFTVSLLNE